MDNISERNNNIQKNIVKLKKKRLTKNLLDKSKLIKFYESKLIKSKYLPEEFIYKFESFIKIISKTYRIKLYNEPHLETFLNKYIPINKEIVIKNIYYENNILWLKTNDDEWFIYLNDKKYNIIII